MPFNTHVSEINNYFLQENDSLFNEKIFPIDILDEDFGTKDLMVSIICFIMILFMQIINY